MIVCGTDFSTPSRVATRAAAALARKQGQKLLLATVLESHSVVAREEVEPQLTRESDELRQAFGVDIETTIAAGMPDEQLLRLTKERAARLVVLGAASGERR